MDCYDVHDRISFTAYVAQLRSELDDPTKHERWSSVDLPNFLDAMIAWTDDCEKPTSANPWRHAAVLLTAAAIYE